MPNITVTVPLNGGPLDIPLAVDAMDGVTPDTTTPLTVSGSVSVCVASLVDPRTLRLTPVAPGSASFIVDESAPLLPSRRLNISVTVPTPPPDLRQIRAVGF